MVGLIVFTLALYLTDVFRLETLHWVLDRATTLGPVALVILFFPELRRVLESFGRMEFWRTSFSVGELDPMRKAIQECVQAATRMSKDRIGALIVWERSETIEIGKGAAIDAEVSAPLLRTIFHPGSPLHDGAVLIRENKIVQAAVYFPELSKNEQIPDYFHTRHRAGIGVTEHFDCVAIIVSEESGAITMAQGGSWTTELDAGRLRRSLEDLFIGPEETPFYRKMGTALGRVRFNRKNSAVKRTQQPAETTDA